ncbi:hypothetical protein ABID22_002171 [Pontibacter aydingkolensis]
MIQYKILLMIMAGITIIDFSLPCPSLQYLFLL